MTDEQLRTLNEEVSAEVMGNQSLRYPVRPYSTDIAAAWDMEEEIARRGLTAEYGTAMTCMILVACRVAGKGQTYYDFIHASPELRCRAAIAAVRGANNTKALRAAQDRK